MPDIFPLELIVEVALEATYLPLFDTEFYFSGSLTSLGTTLINISENRSSVP